MLEDVARHKVLSDWWLRTESRRSIYDPLPRRLEILATGLGYVTNEED